MEVHKDKHWTSKRVKIIIVITKLSSDCAMQLHPTPRPLASEGHRKGNMFINLSRCKFQINILSMNWPEAAFQKVSFSVMNLKTILKPCLLLFLYKVLMILYLFCEGLLNYFSKPLHKRYKIILNTLHKA